jgi:hypothetical protein
VRVNRSKVMASASDRALVDGGALRARRADRGLVRQLADGGLEGDAPLGWAKGSTWVLDTNQGRVVGARYLAPLRPKDLAGHY